MPPAKDTVIVTGSSGLIGFPLCERLAHKYNVVGFDREGPPHPPRSVDAESVDLTDDASIRKAMDRIRSDYGDKIASVVNLAAYYDFSGAPSPLYNKVTVQGTGRLLRALAGFRVEQFLFSSTMLVHAPCRPGEKINEDWPLDPKWPYPQSKADTEKLLLAERGGIPVVFHRIAGVYTDACQSIPIANQIQRIHDKTLTSRLFPGDLAAGQSFVHLDDVVDVLELTVDRRAALPPELPLLIGEPETLGYGELQKTIGRLVHGKDWRTLRIPKFIGKMGAWLQEKLPFFGDPFIKPWMIDLADEHYALDIARAEKLLGWAPRRSLRETLPQMIAALKADPAAWHKTNKLKHQGSQI